MAASSSAAAAARACGVHQPVAAASPARAPARVPVGACASSEAAAAAPLRHSIKHLRGKRRVFFLDVNPLCYEGSHPSLASFARWVELFFSRVALRDPVVAVRPLDLVDWSLQMVLGDDGGLFLIVGS